jgi:hypothetical protein
MKCDQCMDLYIESDNRSTLPFSARRHIARCAACSGQVAKMEAARTALRASLPKASTDCSSVVMAAVGLAKRPRREVGVREWIISFLAILLSMVLAPLGADFTWVKALFGSGYLLPFNIVFGIALTVYCVVFIASHLDTLSERFGIGK